MKKLEAEKDKVVAIYKDADPLVKQALAEVFGEDALKPKITDRVQRIEDAFEVAGINYKEYLAQCAADNLEPHEAAHRILTRVGIPVLNEGWVARPGDSSQRKHFPIFTGSGSSGSRFSFRGSVCGNDGSHVGSRLTLASEELSDHAGKVYTEVYEQLLTK